MDFSFRGQRRLEDKCGVRLSFYIIYAFASTDEQCGCNVRFLQFLPKSRFIYHLWGDTDNPGKPDGVDRCTWRPSGDTYHLGRTQSRLHIRAARSNSGEGEAVVLKPGCSKVKSIATALGLAYTASKLAASFEAQILDRHSARLAQCERNTSCANPLLFFKPVSELVTVPMGESIESSIVGEAHP